MSDVILHHYNLNLKIVVKTDTSDYVSKDILSQYDENNVLHLIAYFFKKYNSAECNYESYDKELIIIICTFEEWHSELKDSIYSIDVITDYKNLEYFMSRQKVITYWVSAIVSYILTLPLSHYAD